MLLHVYRKKFEAKLLHFKTNARDINVFPFLFIPQYLTPSFTTISLKAFFSSLGLVRVHANFVKRILLFTRSRTVFKSVPHETDEIALGNVSKVFRFIPRHWMDFEIRRFRYACIPYTKSISGSQVSNLIFSTYSSRGYNDESAIIE